MNTHQDLDSRADDDHDDHDGDPIAVAAPAPTGVKIVVNGRTVVHRHFLQQAMDAMVRRAVAEEPLVSSH